MKQEMLGLRHRWHGFLRRRLERLRIHESAAAIT